MRHPPTEGNSLPTTPPPQSRARAGRHPLLCPQLGGQPASGRASLRESPRDAFAQLRRKREHKAGK